MPKPSAKRGASSGAKRSAGTHEVQHHRPSPALRHRDDDEGGEGGLEPSSPFLALGNDLVFHAIGFLDVDSLAKLEMVAKNFKRLTAPHWKALDKQAPLGCRSSSSVPRTRAIRFHVASRFAHLASQGWPISDFFDVWKENTAYQKNLKPTFEYFVRFFDRKTDKVLAQGFTTGVSEPSRNGLFLPLDKIDLSRWPALHALMPMNFFERPMKSVFRETGIVIVALKKTSRTPCLSLAFASREYTSNNDTPTPTLIPAIGEYKPMSYPRRGDLGRVYDRVRCCTFLKGTSKVVIYLDDRSS